jgi:hypothetical protein
LEPDHHDDLIRRGLTAEDIKRNKYASWRSYNRGPLATYLTERYFEQLDYLPGMIRQGEEDRWVFTGTASGLLVPVRDYDGRAIALKVRQVQEPKYLFWSSAMEGGESPGNPVHVALCPVDTPTRTVRVTEGELKADVAFARTNLFTISVPGVSNWRSCLPVLHCLEVRKVLVAYDLRDLHGKFVVLQNLREFLGELKRRNLEYGIEIWDDFQKYKGIDDALAADRLPQELLQEEADNYLARIKVYPVQTADTQGVTHETMPATAVVVDPGKDAKKREKTLAVVDLSTRKPTRIDWLWEHWIPRRALSEIVGDPGLGKSTMMISIVARTTRGLRVDDDTQPVEGGPGDVVLLATEDDLDSVILPRLIAAGADLARVHPISGVTLGDGTQRSFLFPDDLPLLKELITQHTAALVGVDPLSAFLSSRHDPNNDVDIRRVLTPVAMLAEETGAAILSLRHPNKNNGASAVYRGGGSIAFTAAARSALVVGQHPDEDGVNVLAHSKVNLVPGGKAIRYSLESCQVTVYGQEGLAVETGQPVIKWGGAVELTADQIITRPDHQKGPRTSAPVKTKKQLAMEYLPKVLAKGGRPVQELEAHWAAMGHSKQTLDDAKKVLGIKSTQQGRGKKRGWIWELP